MFLFNALAWIKAGCKSKKNDKKKEQPEPESPFTPPPRPSLLNIVTAGKREFPPHPAVPPSGLQVVLEKMDEICDRARATNKELQRMRYWYEVVLTEYEDSYAWKEDRAYNWDETTKEMRAELTETKGKIEQYVAELEALEKKHRELTAEGAQWLMDRFWLRRGDFSKSGEVIYILKTCQSATKVIIHESAVPQNHINTSRKSKKNEEKDTPTNPDASEKPEAATIPPVNLPEGFVEFTRFVETPVDDAKEDWRRRMNGVSSRMEQTETRSRYLRDQYEVVMTKYDELYSNKENTRTWSQDEEMLRNRLIDITDQAERLTGEYDSLEEGFQQLKVEEAEIFFGIVIHTPPKRGMNPNWEFFRLKRKSN
ncbi:hypothetical protein GE09DRAFT_1247354 [Coniochaeta sp. 2T2.1]|nr:hypothetical protein GE09DRAFT_1247354 [Coniochaeta sp. 2T2.1]